MEARKLESQEKVMDYVLTEHAEAVHLPGLLTRQLIAQAQNEGNDIYHVRQIGADTRNREMEIYDAATEGAVVVEFYLEHSHNLDLDKVYDYLQVFSY